MAFPTNIVDVDTPSEIEFFTSVFINSTGKIFVPGMMEVEENPVLMDGVFIQSVGKIFVPGMIDSPFEVESFGAVFIKPGSILPRVYSRMIEIEIINIPPTSGNMFEIAVREPEIPVRYYPPIIYEGDILLNSDLTSNLLISSNDLARDPGLETAILISLLSDKRAREYENLPDPQGNLRGWWADAVQKDEIGSKLWLLERVKLDARAVERAEHYVLDALAWMVEDGVAIKVETEVTILSKDTLGISISIYRTTDLVTKYFYNWNKQIIGKGS